MPIVLRLTLACNHIYLLFLSVVLSDEESQSALESLQNVLPGYRHLPSYNSDQKGPISMVCKQCQNCVFLYEVADIRMVQPISV